LGSLTLAEEHPSVAQTTGLEEKEATVTTSTLYTGVKASSILSLYSSDCCISFSKLFLAVSSMIS